MSSPGMVEYKVAFELSPIILVGGIAAQMAGGVLSIVNLLEGGDTEGLGLDDHFANFIPMPQATLIDQDVGTYPFANQAVAANAVIAKPRTISLHMICPVKRPGGYPERFAIMTSLQSTLANHNNQGGTYTVATPSGYFANCLLIALRDITAGESAQAQTDWQWDFYMPLLTLQDAQSAQGNLMSRVTNGSRVTDPAWSSAPAQPTIGVPGSIQL